MKTIAFTGGGTGGHIYPGLAVIEYLRKQAEIDFRIIWLGSGKGRDRSIVEAAGIEFFAVPAGKLRRYFSLKTIPDIFRVISGFFAARKILKKNKADILFSKGGFVSVPPCAAAASLRIPVFTHESDFTPGLATKLNLHFVQKKGGRAFTAYSDTVNYFPAAFREKVTVSGNPIRLNFRSADPLRGRAFLETGQDEKILLVLGGSQGAREVNNLLHETLGDLCRLYTVVHQFGPDNVWDVPRSDKYIPFPYFNDEMPHVMAAANVILGRAGAGTVWESAVLGKPMILIPLCGSGTRGDQVENARYFEKEGAAVVLIGQDVTPEKLVNTVNSIFQDTGQQELMATSACRIGSLDGAAIIGDSIRKFIFQDNV